MNAIVSNEPARGFSLIEIAVVVAIVMMLLTLGLGLMNAQISSAATTVTKKRQEAIKDALIAYLGANKRLPCPYAPTAGTLITGMDPDLNPNPYAVPPNAVCASFGVIPFATLGLGREIAEDGWGNLFSYQVFSDSPPTIISCPGPAKDWGHSACFGAGKAAATSITVLDNTAGTNLQLTTNAIAVIISHGPNGLGAWAAQATPNAPPVSCEERKNANGDLSGCPIPPGVTPPYYFFKGERQDQDDVVAWVDGREAINALAKQGVIKSATAQVNDDLQIRYEQALGLKLARITSTTSSTDADGKTTTNTFDCNGQASPIPSDFSSRRDPWGYQYAVSDGTTDWAGTTGTTAPTNLPICVCSGNSAALPIPAQCPSIPPTSICKIISKETFNSYLGNRGNCP